jgi:hypothetical protein
MFHADILKDIDNMQMSDNKENKSIKSNLNQLHSRQKPIILASLDQFSLI